MLETFYLLVTSSTFHAALYVITPLMKLFKVIRFSQCFTVFQPINQKIIIIIFNFNPKGINSGVDGEVGSAAYINNYVVFSGSFTSV